MCAPCYSNKLTEQGFSYEPMEVVKDDKETAIIWLNEENAKVLDKQLKEEQQTSIQQLNKSADEEDDKLVQRFAP